MSAEHNNNIGRPRLVKLVRDRIGDLLADSIVSYEPVPESERLTWVRRKVREEAIEYADDPCLEELADVYQALCDATVAEGLTMTQLQDEVERKKAERGGFEHGIGMYLSTTTPGDRS
jgi:predicted house-cleaning noncanonical NTP pyrophosphatase (MazG superfamily)